MEESVYGWDSFTVMLRARMAFLYSLASNVAAHNSNLGIVSCFSGATFDVEHRSSHDVLLLLSVERMYRQAPSILSLLLQNPCILNVGSIRCL